MKLLNVFSYSGIIIILFALLSTVFAQSDRDPFMGNYILGNSAELFLTGSYKNNDGFTETVNESWDYLSPFGQIVKRNFITGLYNYFSMDAIAADFNGDGFDDVAFAGRKVQFIPPFSRYVRIEMSEFPGSLSPNIVSSLDIEDNGAQIRMAAGDFDDDAPKEFILGFIDNDKNIRLTLYETDSTLQISELAQITESFGANIDPFEDDEAMYDISVGDFDMDGLDEIAVVRSLQKFERGDENWIGTLKFGITIYDYDHLTHGLSILTETTFEPEIDLSEEGLINDFIPVTGQLKRLSLDCGNLNLDHIDDMVIAYSYDYWTSEPLPFIPNLRHHINTRIHTFDVDISTLEIKETVDFEDPSKVYCERLNEINLGPVKEQNKSNIEQFNIPLTLVCANLDNDARDEILCCGGDSIKIYKPDNTLRLTNVHQIPSMPYRFDVNTPRTFIVTDIDADTSQVQMADSDTTSPWMPEIVAITYMPGLNDQVELNTVGILNVYKKTGPEISSYISWGALIPVNRFNSFAMAAGDFDGDGIRLRKPHRFTAESVIQPTVILNAPPVHFDVINDTSYDICSSYDGSSDFFATYKSIGQVSNMISTQINSDWGISSSLTLKAFAAGNGVKSTLTGKYGEGFSKTRTASETITISQEIDATLEDRIYATQTDYDFWEYPVYFQNEHLGNVLVANPTPRENIWHSGREWDHFSYTANHEVGNILSYKQYTDVNNNPAVSELAQSSFMLSGYELDATSSQKWSLNYESFNSTSTDITREFGFGIDVLAKAGFDAKIGFVDIETGIELAAEAHYDNTEINTHKTSIYNEWEIDVNLSSVDMAIGDVKYTVTPYVYWSRNGALVVDYSVKPKEADPGYDPSWWQVQYGEYPDLAFILPWRFDPEKGSTLPNEEARFRTKEIMFKPTEPAPGDTIVIITRIHNFSLSSLEADSISLRYYMGDPDNGGQPLTGILYHKQLTDYSDIEDPRGETFFHTQWVVPVDLVANPRIYAVIDPDNEIDEIQESNNKGWTVLTLEGLTDINEEISHNSISGFHLFQNYPNPFNPSTNIQYSIPNAENVEISIYNVLGQKVKTVVNAYQQRGHHTTIWSGTNEQGLSVGSGIYFYRIKAGNYYAIKKMVFIK